MGYEYSYLIGKLSIFSGHIITMSSMYAEQSTHLALGGGGDSAGEVIMQPVMNCGFYYPEMTI